MVQDIQIRKASFEEFQSCADIVNDWIDDCDWLPRLHSREAIADSFTKELFGERIVLIAVNNNEIVGYMALGLKGWVHGLYLRSQYRNAGIGRLLMNEAKRLFPQKLELRFWEKNTGARKFYTREGFVEIPTDRLTDTDEGVDELLMRWVGP